MIDDGLRLLVMFVVGGLAHSNCQIAEYHGLDVVMMLLNACKGLDSPISR